MIKEKNKALCALLKDQVDMLCDSHTEKEFAGRLSKVQRTAAKMMTNKKFSSQWRIDFVELLANSAYHGIPSIVVEKDSIFINGNFDMKQLGKALTIGGVPEEIIDARELT